MLNKINKTQATHESAYQHVTGQALYIDDLPEYPNQLHLYPCLSEQAHAKILAIDTSDCYQVEGVKAVISHADIPGNGDIGAIFAGEPLLAKETVSYYGQPIVVIAATSFNAAQKAAKKVKIQYSPLTHTTDIKTAYQKNSFINEPHQHNRGDARKAIASSAHQISGQASLGGQEHFYLETQASFAIAEEDQCVKIYTSSQNPTEIQHLVAKVLGIDMHKVTVIVRRMGGAFGGKETQASLPACLSALVAVITGQPTKMRLTRQDDMTITGKRHPFYYEYQVGFDEQGLIKGIRIDLMGNCGYCADLSNAIVDRAMFHADNAYFLSNAKITGHRCKTHTASNTAFRGFGGPQGMFIIEHIIDEIAYFLGKDPLRVRKLNYYGIETRNQTHYYQTINDNILPEITTHLEKTCDYTQRRKAISQFNQKHSLVKKGLAITPVKFGISFTKLFLNQAGALIHIYTDGSIQINHGGTEMGQGLHTKVAQIVARAFAVPLNLIQITATRTDKVPNTSPTAASSGTDLNGQAALAAANTIKQRLINFAAKHFSVSEDSVIFKDASILVGEKKTLSFKKLVALAYENRISLSSTGFYKTPTIYYDEKKAQGQPFFYYAYGVSCSEVIIDVLTGEYKLLRVDIVHDVGESLNESIDKGQIEGGFVQGLGWLTTEELVWDEKGKLLSNNPATYKIPTAGDIPKEFNTHFWHSTRHTAQTVFHSKAIGEPPFMLAFSVFSALKNAVSAVGSHYKIPKIQAPATAENLLKAIEDIKKSD